MNDNYIDPNYSPLHQAVMSGKTEKIKSILQISTLDELFMQASDSEQNNAVDIALKLGREDIAIEIIDYTICMLKKSAVDIALKLGREDTVVKENLDTFYQLSEPFTFVTYSFSTKNKEDSSLVGEFNDE